MIPGGATLIFDIELLDVEEGPKPVNVFKQIDQDADSHISRDELAEYLKNQARYISAKIIILSSDVHVVISFVAFDHVTSFAKAFYLFIFLLGP